MEGSQVVDAVQALLRWLHIFAGILWIGHLYFFNFVNGPFEGTLDPETKKKVVPELRPRALFWFRWGAAWTWITGVLVLMLVFYHGRELTKGQAPWGAGTWVMVAVTFLAVFIYDALFKSPLGKDLKVAGAISFVLVGVILVAMQTWGNFSYRGYVIHLGAMFGTIMAFNVWFRIWPAQRKIIAAIKGAQAPDPALVAMAGGRSRHNTYMSVPLVWAMIDSHTTSFAGGKFGIPGEMGWIGVLVVILLSWHIVWHCYKRAGKVKGL
jgi:uncharacterized membrane protein